MYSSATVPSDRCTRSGRMFHDQRDGGPARGRAVTQHAHPNAHAVKSRNRGFINKRAEHSRLEYVERATFIHNYRCYGCVNVTSMTNQNCIRLSCPRDNGSQNRRPPPKTPARTARRRAAARKGDSRCTKQAPERRGNSEGIEHCSMCPSYVPMYQSMLPRRALRRGRPSLSPRVQRRPRDLNRYSRLLLVPFWDVVQRDDHASWLVRFELGRPDPCVAHQIIRRG